MSTCVFVSWLVEYLINIKIGIYKNSWCLHTVIYPGDGVIFCQLLHPGRKVQISELLSNAAVLLLLKSHVLLLKLNTLINHNIMIPQCTWIMPATATQSRYRIVTPD